VQEDAIGCEMARSEQMTPRGFEPLEGGKDTTSNHGKDLGNQGCEPAEASAAKSGAVQSRTEPQDPELARVVEAWPGLSEDVRRQILDLIKNQPLSI
jgi:hypothetical protein